jgi:Zn-dependent protease
VPDAISLGRPAGIPVSLHWSVAVIAGLIWWSLAAGVLPEVAPGHSTAAYWLVGLGGVVAFLASLLAHELAHAVTARHVGVHVERVELWLLGGIAQIRAEARTPAAEFKIAAVGPAVSLGLAVLSAVAAATLALADTDDLAVAAVGWLAAVNLLLGVFNLVPGSPLDGGRLLRAYLWWRSGDRDQAAIRAARAGRWVGWALIALGVLEFAAGLGAGGLWLVLVGWFLVGAARAEEVGVRTHRALAGVPVRDVMTPAPDTVPSWVTVAELVDRYVLGRHHSGYPVEGLDGGTTGLVTLAQVRGVDPARYGSVLVGDIKIPLASVATAAPGDPVDTLVARLSPESGNRVLVFDGDRLVGIVTAADIARTLEVRALQRG